MAAEFGVVWIADDGRDLGSIGALEEFDAARRQATVAFEHIFPHAARAVIYRGRSREDGVVVAEVKRPGRLHSP